MARPAPVGSFDPGLGSVYLTRRWEKKAREIWYFCRQYCAAEAKRMGLVNEVVPDADPSPRPSSGRARSPP